MRRSLLREARTLLEATGAEALSLREVARRAGVSQAAPYRHFDGKEGLLAGLAAEGFRELAAGSRKEAGRHDDALQAFFAVTSRYVCFALENPRLYPLMFGSVRRRRDPEVAAAGDAAFGVLVESVRACQSQGQVGSGDPMAIALTATALCHGIASFSLDDRTPDSVSTEDFTRLAMRQLVEGIGVEPATD